MVGGFQISSGLTDEERWFLDAIEQEDISALQVLNRLSIDPYYLTVMREMRREELLCGYSPLYTENRGIPCPWEDKIEFLERLKILRRGG